MKTSVNLERELLTHIEFDAGNSTEECKRIIQRRIEERKKAYLKTSPEIWSNVSYTITITALFTQLIIGIFMTGAYFLQK